MELKRKIIVIVLLLCCCGAVILVASSAARHRDEQENNQETYCHLNQVLSNEVSAFEADRLIDKKVRAYLQQWQIKGASLAVMRNDSLLYAKGYGQADEGVEITPGKILRIASVSKLITAAGIMVLQDRDSLSIKDSVFAPGGILDCEPFRGWIRDRNYKNITIEHLLRHQGGFYRDPLFSSKDVKVQMGLSEAPVKEDFFKLVLSHPLRFAPGTSQKYSNFGYLLLSEIIERVSGEPYEEFIRKEVLEKAGCYDFHIAGNYYEDKLENEVRYYTHEGDGKFVEEYNGSGQMVERSYGGNNVTLLSGAGAWCASAAEIARFVASIDGRDEVPDIISKEAVEQMVEYFDENTYSLGWNDTTPEKGWSRTGTLSGTSALVKYFPDGECWIMITNSSTWKGPGLAKYTNSLFVSCRESCKGELPCRNLFLSPNPESDQDHTDVL